jgi:fatty acyl-CoA reductase
MRQLLPIHIVKSLEASDKIIVLSGDITRHNFGLEENALAALQDSVSIFIHAASSINLKHDLSKMAANVIHPSLEASRLALSFTHLERFVYVSTAYVNAFLHFRKHETTQIADCIVEETIYPLRNDSSDDNAFAELKNLGEFGTTPEYSCMPHPFPYSYTKHLTERLLLQDFRAAGREQLLILFRPSIFAPAEYEPVPHFEVAGSTPGTTLLCAILASAPTRVHFASNLLDPSKAAFDEIPIDMVVNRMLAHVAYGSYGCIHAVGGASGRSSFEEAFNAGAKLRPWWWSTPILDWCDEYSGAEKACTMSKTWRILGCSYLFLDNKTNEIWESMDNRTRAKWPLWRAWHPSAMWSLSARSQTAEAMLLAVMEKRYGRLGHFWASMIRPSLLQQSVFGRLRGFVYWLAKIA